MGRETTTVGYERGTKTCRHDEYYDIPIGISKMNVSITNQASSANRYYLDFVDVDASSCGFKVFGSADYPSINYNFYKDGVHYTGQCQWKNVPDVIPDTKCVFI